MLYEEYIKIKNLMNIYQLYESSFFDEKDRSGEVFGTSDLLLIAMCDLEDQRKYPASSSLPDLITFVKQNPKAMALTRYLSNLPGYIEELGHNQGTDTYMQHRFNIDGLYRLPKKSQRDDCEKSCCDLNGEYSIRWTSKGIFLTIHVDDFVIKAERRYETPEKTFVINDVIFENIELHDLINIISFAKLVKVLNLENIHAVYSFLK